MDDMGVELKHEDIPAGAPCAALSVDITPDAAVPLFGYQNRTGLSTFVRQRLEANIFCTVLADGRAFYLVSTDTLYGGTIEPQLLSRLGLAQDQLLVCGSHTHFAPGVDANLPGLGLTVSAYMAEVIEKISLAIEGAGGFQSACVGWAVGNSEDLFVNRRQPTFGVGIQVPKIGRCVTAPNVNGPVDTNVRVARIMSKDRVIAVIWGVSCHPVCCPTADAISPCFPGVVRDQIRSHIGEEVPVLFLQGFSGDVRPNSQSRKLPSTLRNWAHYLLAGGKLFRPQSEREYEEWCSRLSRIVLITLTRAESGATQIVPRSVCFQAPMPFGWSRAPRAHSIQLTKRISLFAVNAEVVSERIESIASDAGDGLVFPVGCCGEVIGYWPTDRMLREGGYEAAGSQCFFPALDWQRAGGADGLWKALVSETSRLVGKV